MKKIFLIITFLFFALVGKASAIPILWTDNGHYYDMVNLSNNLSWNQAVIDSNSLYYDGIQGHLVTITSSEESNFLTNSLKEWQWNGNRWTGAYQVNGTGTSNLGWKWITDEPFVFTNWNPGEPNDASWGIDSENNMTISTWFSPTVGTWYDAPGNPGYVAGYIVEFEKTTSAVPEPATILLFASGLFGVFFRKRAA
jgi:hypothetical protein